MMCDNGNDPIGTVIINDTHNNYHRPSSTVHLLYEQSPGQQRRRRPSSSSTMITTNINVQTSISSSSPTIPSSTIQTTTTTTLMNNKNNNNQQSSTTLFDDNNNCIPLTISFINNGNHQRFSPTNNNNDTSIGTNGGTLTTNHNNNNNNNNTNNSNNNNKMTILLPEGLLESLHKSEHFPTNRHRWNTNEEIAALLISIDQHEKWLSDEVKLRPKSGSMLLYSRKHVRYRRDGYCWKKRKDGKTTREDHMKLKVQGIECIYGCYVHSAILPTFHRRCYWLLQNPDIVLVHYLNVPYNDDNKTISPSLNSLADTKKEWTREDLVLELKPMFFSVNENDNQQDNNNSIGYGSDELEKSTLETIESIVQQLLVKQRARLKALEEQQQQQTTGSTNTTNETGAFLSIRAISSSTSTKSNQSSTTSTVSTSSSSSLNGNVLLNAKPNNNNNNNNIQHVPSNNVKNNNNTNTIHKVVVKQQQHQNQIQQQHCHQIFTSLSSTGGHHLQSTANDITDINGNSIMAVANNNNSNSKKQQTVQLVQLTTSSNGTMCQLAASTATSISPGGSDPGHQHHGHQLKDFTTSFNERTPSTSTNGGSRQQQTSPTSLILNMSQIQSSFIILNNNQQQQQQTNQHHIHQSQQKLHSGLHQINLTTPTNNAAAVAGTLSGHHQIAVASTTDQSSTPITFVAYRSSANHRTGQQQHHSTSRIFTNVDEQNHSLTAKSSTSNSSLSSIAFKVPINVEINSNGLVGTHSIKNEFSDSDQHQTATIHHVNPSSSLNQHHHQQQQQQPATVAAPPPMFAALTNTKNSVMTPIFSVKKDLDDSSSATIISNNKNVPTNSTDNDITMAVVNEIEMDTLTTMDLEGRPFNLDDEESMLICNSNASTPERSINMSHHHHHHNAHLNAHHHHHHLNHHYLTATGNSDLKFLVAGNHEPNHLCNESNNNSNSHNKNDENHSTTVTCFDDSCFDVSDATCLFVDDENVCSTATAASLMNCLGPLDGGSHRGGPSNNATCNDGMSKPLSSSSSPSSSSSSSATIQHQHLIRDGLMASNTIVHQQSNHLSNRNDHHHSNNVRLVNSLMHNSNMHHNSFNGQPPMNLNSANGRPHHQHHLSSKVPNIAQHGLIMNATDVISGHHATRTTSSIFDDGSHDHETTSATIEDFMDHEDIPTSDEILFNLETFDMFGEFDNLDGDEDDDEQQVEHEQTNSATSSSSVSHTNQSNQVNEMTGAVDTTTTNNNNNINNDKTGTLSKCTEPENRNVNTATTITTNLIRPSLGTYRQFQSLQTDPKNIPTSTSKAALSASTTFLSSTANHVNLQPSDDDSDSYIDDNIDEDDEDDDDKDLDNIPTCVKEFWTNANNPEQMNTVGNNSYVPTKTKKKTKNKTGSTVIPTGTSTNILQNKKWHGSNNDNNNYIDNMDCDASGNDDNHLDCGRGHGSNSINISSIDVSNDNNGNFSSKNIRTRNACQQMQFSSSTSSSSSQNYPLLKRQLSNSQNNNIDNESLLIKTSSNGTNDDKNNNVAANSNGGNNFHQQQRQSNNNQQLVHSSSNSANSGQNNDINNNGSNENNNNNSSDPPSPNSAKSSACTSSNNGQQINNITDYSPEWCYTDGGIKVLVAGPWSCNDNNETTTTKRFSILFDQIPVATELVQNGLLRCFSPKRSEPGLVTLQVSCNDVIISNSVIFEYRSSSSSSSSTANSGTNNKMDYFNENTKNLSTLDTLNQKASSSSSSSTIVSTSSPSSTSSLIFKQSSMEQRNVED